VFAFGGERGPAEEQTQEAENADTGTARPDDEGGRSGAAAGHLCPTCDKFFPFAAGLAGHRKRKGH